MWRLSLQTTAKTAPSRRRLLTTKSVAEPEKTGWDWTSVAGPVVGFGFIGAIVGWFYRGSKNGSNRKLKQRELAAKAPLAPDEVTELRKANGLKVSHFLELVRRLNLTEFASQEHPDPHELLEFCATNLGGVFAQEGKLQSSHLIERVLLSSPDLSYGDLLLVLSLGVSADHTVEERVDLLSRVFPRESGIPDDPLSFTDVANLVDGLAKTSQLPVSVRVEEENVYPFNLYHEIDGTRMLERAVDEIEKQRAKDKNGVENKRIFAEDEESGGKSLGAAEDLFELLVASKICVWGSCR